MSISRRFFNAGAACLAAKPRIPTKHPHPADLLEYTQLPENYVVLMGRVLETISGWDSAYQEFVKTARMFPQNGSARLLTEEALYKFGDTVMLFIGTDWRDLFLLIHDERFVRVMDKLKLQYDGIFNQDVLSYEILDHAVYANGEIRAFLPLAERSGDDTTVAKFFLNRHFLELDESLSNLSRDDRLLAHFEQLCFSRYGVFGGKFITPAMAADYEAKHYGFDGALNNIEGFIRGAKAKSFAGPHTLASQQRALREIKSQLLQKFKKSNRQLYRKYKATHQFKSVSVSQTLTGAVKSVVTASTRASRTAIGPSVINVESLRRGFVQFLKTQGGMTTAALPAPEASFEPAIPIVNEPEKGLARLDMK